MSNLSYAGAMEALKTIQKQNFDPDNPTMFNLCAALANLTGALERDLEQIKRDLADLKRRK